MTPERIAELRGRYGITNSVMDEALDEIERLRAIVLDDHRLGDRDGWWWCRCGVAYFDCMLGTTHAEHVAAILDGTT